MATTPSLDRVTDGDTVVPHRTDHPDHPERRLPFAGVFNFRDLGGYVGAGGRPIRWRTLYRADALHRLTDTELDELGGLGVRSVLDLRTAGEVAKGRIEAHHLGIAHHHLPVLDETWTPQDLDPEAAAEEVLGSLYVQMLDIGAPALAGAFELLADPANVPAVFHCAAGKDRTGVLAALVLEVLGVRDEVIVADYALTAHAMELLVEKLKVDAPDSLTAMNDQPAAYLAAPAGAMEHFLRELRARFGSAVGYAHQIGVGDDVLDSVRASLLQP